MMTLCARLAIRPRFSMILQGGVGELARHRGDRRQIVVGQIEIDQYQLEVEGDAVYLTD